MRIFRLIATPVLLLGLLAFLVWGAFWGWRNLTAPVPPPEPTPCVLVELEMLTPPDVSVRVYNGGFTSGLAYREAQRLGKAGFDVIRTGNTDERITTTLIRGSRSSEEALQLTLSYYKDAAIDYDDRVDGTIDVMVGTEFGGAAKEPLTEIELKSGSTCVPPSEEPTIDPSASPEAGESTPAAEDGASAEPDKEA